MAGVPTEMTFNTTSTVMTSQRDNTMHHDNALPVTCHSHCASHRTMHMSYRSKTYTWNDVILVKRSLIRFFYILLFTFRTFKNSTGFHYSIAEGIVVFQYSPSLSTAFFRIWTRACVPTQQKLLSFSLFYSRRYKLFCRISLSAEWCPCELFLKASGMW